MNQTTVTEILLLGFQNLHNFRIPFFSLILLIYILTFCANVLILVLVSVSRNLQSPMYFFLQQLSICDLLQTTTIVPIMLQTIIKGRATITIGWCITQWYLFGGSEIWECLLLTAMSFDRYVAICNPLHYSSIIDHKVCVKLVILLWLTGFGVSLVMSSSIGTLVFCKQTAINHFFCDFAPLLELSCSDSNFVHIEAALLSIPTLITPFIIVIISYICIARAILKIVSSIGRQKAFSTCSSHLAVVSIFYGTLIGIYVVPNQGQSVTKSKVISLLYTVVTPLLNPIIYTLRNKDIKDVCKKVLDIWATHIY
ncbi:olfactory receptor 11L1-like [Xenopus tropicalis]|uniref:Olfactory receptor n=1 Tax=Xenopus tropicalis TaxID=8364 RepID=A0A8J1J8L8_XENTR|nr:olfactory receptor 11L1-like [Xenopus tropicalis]